MSTAAANDVGHVQTVCVHKRAKPPGGIMELMDEPFHVCENDIFCLTDAVGGFPSLALSHAHSSPSGVKAYPHVSARWMTKQSRLLLFISEGLDRCRS